MTKKPKSTTEILGNVDKQLAIYEKDLQQRLTKHFVRLNSVSRENVTRQANSTAQKNHIHDGENTDPSISNRIEAEKKQTNTSAMIARYKDANSWKDNIFDGINADAKGDLGFISIATDKFNNRHLDEKAQTAFNLLFNESFKQLIKEYHLVHECKQILNNEQSDDKKIEKLKEIFEKPENMATINGGDKRSNILKKVFDTLATLGIYALVKAKQTYQERQSFAFWKSSSQHFKNKIAPDFLAPHKSPKKNKP